MTSTSMLSPSLVSFTRKKNEWTQWKRWETGRPLENTETKWIGMNAKVKGKHNNNNKERVLEFTAAIRMWGRSLPFILSNPPTQSFLFFRILLECCINSLNFGHSSMSMWNFYYRGCCRCYSCCSSVRTKFMEYIGLYETSARRPTMSGLSSLHIIAQSVPLKPFHSIKASRKFEIFEHYEDQ